MLKAVILFVVGLVFLIFGGDWFVDGAVSIAKRLRVPEILIGSTIVSIGTTLPEVMVSATSAAMGHGSVAYGNAVGSIICNTALILAITIAIRPADATAKDILIPSLFFFIAAAFYAFVSYTFKNFSRFCGITLLVIFVIYMFITVRQSIKASRASAKEDTSDFDVMLPAKKCDIKENVKKQGIKAVRETFQHYVILLGAGAALIAVGADLLVDNGTLIAQYFNVPESVIALTFVALGTSLPELVTAVISLVKGHGALSLGNIIGANLFNLVLVGGLSITISPFTVPCEKTISGLNAALIVDVPLMIIVMLILIVPVLIRKKLSRVQGFVLLAVYAGFCVFQFCF